MCIICKKEVTEDIEELKIYNCSDIKVLPYFPNLKVLYIYHCQNIKQSLTILN